MYRRLVQLVPGDPDAALELARTLEAAGRGEEALALYEDVHQRFPDAAAGASAQQRLDELAERRPPAKAKRSIAVRIQRSGSAILVDGQVEGAPDVRFLLDTGSTLTIISTELAEELGFDLRAANHRYVRLETANGPVEAPLVTLETVKIGGVVARDVQAAVYDVRAVDPIDGLLGLSFLDHFRYTIDARAQTMRFEPR
jgi:clan AA aspartic protease (TIGR02281 family)